MPLPNLTPDVAWNLPPVEALFPGELHLFLKGGMDLPDVIAMAGRCSKYTEERALLDSQGAHLACGIWTTMLLDRPLTHEERKQLDATVTTYAHLFGAVVQLFVDTFLEGYDRMTSEQRKAAVAFHRSQLDRGLAAIDGAREKVPS